MHATVSTTYDELPYESSAIGQSQPGRLAAIGMLFGMQPAPLVRCRVLELGCASGGNLIPLAASWPQATFVGLDMSARQIAEAQQTVAQLELKNIDFRHQSLLDVDQGLGQFDYIIAHGIFSWVPESVREKILAICKENLSPQGIAFVSYNTYPGWHMIGMIRDMMLYHTGRFSELREKVPQARSLLKFLADSVRRMTGSGLHLNSYQALLAEEVENVSRYSDAYLAHEHLEEENQPVYFYQFMEMAARRGLQYLADAQVGSMVPSNFPAEIMQALAPFAVDNTSTEQYLDFLRNRTFRQSLLCHPEVSLTRALSPASFVPFHMASSLRPTSANPDLAAGVEECFQNPRGDVFKTSTPITKAFFVRLAEVWPRAEPFAAILAAARARLAGQAVGAPEGDVHVVGTDLWTAYSAELIELYPERLPLVVEVSERPTASPVARLQAAAGGKITNQRHEMVEGLDDFSRCLLQHLDGSRDREALVAQLAELAAQEIFVVTCNNLVVRDRSRLKPMIAGQLEGYLTNLAKLAFLVG